MFMIRLPEPHQLRPLGQALRDLVEKYERVPLGHPLRHNLSRMIRLLTAELTRFELAPGEDQPRSVVPKNG